MSARVCVNVFAFGLYIHPIPILAVLRWPGSVTQAQHAQGGERSSQCRNVCVLWPGCMQVVGQKVAQLEARKRAAVEKEDYDTAKIIKVRACVHANLRCQDPGPQQCVLQARLCTHAACQAAHGCFKVPHQQRYACASVNLYARHAGVHE